MAGARQAIIGRARVAGKQSVSYVDDGMQEECNLRNEWRNIKQDLLQ
jgi:hypothetical protein